MGAGGDLVLHVEPARALGRARQTEPPELGERGERRVVIAGDELEPEPRVEELLAVGIGVNGEQAAGEARHRFGTAFRFEDIRGNCDSGVPAPGRSTIDRERIAHLVDERELPALGRPRPGLALCHLGVDRVEGACDELPARELLAYRGDRVVAANGQLNQLVGGLDRRLETHQEAARPRRHARARAGHAIRRDGRELGDSHRLERLEVAALHRVGQPGVRRLDLAPHADVGGALDRDSSVLDAAELQRRARSNQEVDLGSRAIVVGRLPTQHPDAWLERVERGQPLRGPQIAAQRPVRGPVHLEGAHGRDIEALMRSGAVCRCGGSGEEHRPESRRQETT